MLKRALLVLGSAVALFGSGCVGIPGFAKVLHDLAEGTQAAMAVLGITSLGNLTGGLFT